MTTITGNFEEVKAALRDIGIPATNLPTAREFSVTFGGNSADVVRTDVGEYANIDLDLTDPSGSVLWMVEGVEPKDVEDIKSYLDNYLEVMADVAAGALEDSPLLDLTQEQIEQTHDYQAALRALMAWKAGNAT